MKSFLKENELLNSCNLSAKDQSQGPGSDVLTFSARGGERKDEANEFLTTISKDSDNLEFNRSSIRFLVSRLSDTPQERRRGNTDCRRGCRYLGRNSIFDLGVFILEI